MRPVALLLALEAAGGFSPARPTWAVQRSSVHVVASAHRADHRANMDGDWAPRDERRQQLEHEHKQRQPWWRQRPSRPAAVWHGAAVALGATVAGLASGTAPAWAAEAPPAEVGAPAPKLSTAARKRLMLSFKSKLAKVPVFMVTNEAGSPFLNQLGSGDQSALMFLFPAEAEKMLQGVLKAPNGAASGAKVLPTNLDRAFKLARLKPMASGLRDQVSNRELTMVWQFMPHAAEQRAAQMVLAKSGKLSAPAVPAYMVDGLVIVKRGKEVRPVFLCKKDCDAALAAVVEAQGEGDDSADSGAGKVVVYDALRLLLQLATDIEAGEPEAEAELASIELVPPSESIEFREQLKRDKPKLKAKIVPPDHRMH